MAAETAVSFVVNKVSNLLVEEASLLVGVKDQVEWLRDQLGWMKSFLKDAYTKRRRGDERAKQWERAVQEAAYRVEDIIESYMIETTQGEGDLQTAEPYLHIKPMLGGTFTDITIWVFYPFNGPAKAKVEFFNIPLGRIGEHVGDWEHLTLRISNFSGELHSLYFSEHSAGSWVDASQLEFATGNKPVAYASLNGHAFYPKAGLVLQGNTKLGIWRRSWLGWRSYYQGS